MRIEGGRAAAIGAVLAAWAIAIGGCPGTLENKKRFLTGGTGGSSVVCPDVPSDIFAGQCGGPGCHGPASPPAGLDLQSPGVASRVVKRPAQMCEGLLADPLDPEASVLYTKLLDSPPCGERMPYGIGAMSEYEIECVKEWIAIQNPDVPPFDAGSGDAGDDAADGG